MSDLSEAEIFDCLEANVMLAAQDCVNIAGRPQNGDHFHNFLKRLKLIDGAARQASAWREDSRWLNFFPVLLAAENNAARWLRSLGSKSIFLDLAKVFLEMHRCMIHIKTSRTGRSGMILPDELPGPHRDTRPSRVILPPGMNHSRPSGLIVPAGMA